MKLFLQLPATKIKISIARVLYKIVTFFYGNEPIIVKRGGIVYELDLSEGIDLSVFLFGSFQKHVTNNKLLQLNKHSLILDVGANYGIISLQYAQIATKGNVYSFEPTQYAITKLRKNISLNPELASRIEIVNAFVSSKSGTNNNNLMAFSSWKLSDQSSEKRHPIHLGGLKSTEGAELISLDDFFINHQVKKIDLIKIDTDGHEHDVLLGGQKIITKHRPKIIFEIGLYLMEERKIDFSTYEAFFNQLDYKLYNAHSLKQINLGNYKTHIPAKGSIDIIAIPS